MRHLDRRRHRRLGLLVGPALLVASAPAQATVEVPLVPYTSHNHPNGFALGWALGVSFGDYDADGWVDLYNNLRGELWRNDAGRDWVLAANLLPALAPRYGASFADYDRDGLPDLATEPRPTACFNLFHNDGNGRFTDVAGVPAVFAARPCLDASETACWGDVDFDGWPDLFLPTYPPPLSRQDNYFWRNSDPLPPYPERVFVEMSRAAGLAIPPGRERPEGAQLCDYDGDGDLDLYSNGGIYRNESTLATPRFAALSTTATGIGRSGVLDEGAAFFDYDLDGDFDVMTCHVGVAVSLWESRGDGTFFPAEPGVIESPALGSDFGLSIADWDNDGDHDVTTRFAFRRNQLMETGQRLFTLATHQVQAVHVVQPTIAWADSDRDGDLDAAIGNLWLAGHGTGHFYENTTQASTPNAARRYVRVVPKRDEPSGVATETEYGAAAELRLAGERVRRRQFTASGHGYLNQNEYALHFALPPTWVVADVSVDFPSDPAQGIWRVDGAVNPVLRGVRLSGLADRTIAVLRSGRVLIDGCDVSPVPQESPALQGTAGGLALPDATAGLPVLQAATSENTFVGVEVRTAAQPVRIAEVEVDGRLRASGPFQLAVWDVTVRGAPRLVDSRAAATPARNERAAVAVDVLLRPDRVYRVVAAVDWWRATSMQGPAAQGVLTTTGGLRYVDPQQTTGRAAAEAPVDPGRLYLALRFRAALLGVGIDLGNGLTTRAGTPAQLTTPLPFAPGKVAELQLTGLPPLAPVMLAFGVGARGIQYEGKSFLVPGGLPVVVAGALVADEQGVVRAPLPWPVGLPTGLVLAFQGWYPDPATPTAFASTNLVVVASP